MTLIDLYSKAEAEGIEVNDFKMREIKAVSFSDNSIAIDTSRIGTRLEEKIILAHEIGHCETGGFYNIHSSYDVKAKCEYRANKRAYQILVPHDDLIDALGKGITEVWELAEYFDVPCDFMEKAMAYWRMVDLAG